MNFQLDTSHNYKYTVEMSHETIEGSAVSHKSRPKVIMFTDPGRDSDDTFAFVQARRLQTLFELGLPVAVTTLTPALRRAQLAQYISDNVGLSRTKIAAGSDLPTLSVKDIHPYEFAGVPDGYGMDRISQDPTKMIRETLETADNKSVDILVIAGFTDLHKFIENPKEADMLAAKAQRIVIMGGVQTTDGQPTTDKDGFLHPDASSNYQFDPEAAQKVIRFAQEQHIPLRFVSRHAAYAAQLPRNAYENAGKSDNPVGVWLRDTVSAGFQSLWERANSPIGSPGRALPDRCDRQWFIDTFCGKDHISIHSADSIWPFIKAITPYDPLAMIATVPQLMDRFYKPHVVTVNGTQHEIIGLSPEVTGVKSPHKLRAFLAESLTKGLEVVREDAEKYYTTSQISDEATVTIRGAGLRNGDYPVAAYGGPGGDPREVYVQDGYTSVGDPKYRRRPVTYTLDGDLIFADEPMQYDY